MKTFLVVYSRSRGKLLEIREYDESERERALSDRFERELRESGDPDIEVVLLGASSREALERTHSRYFRTPGEIASNIA